MCQEMNTALCAMTASGILRNGPTNSTARLEGENGLQKRLGSRLFLPRPLPLVGGNVTDAAERTCSRASKCYQCSTPTQVDIVGVMRALTQKETGVCSKRSIKCLKPSRGRSRGGRKHNKKKVCRCGSVHHQPHRGHRLPRRVKGLSTVQVVEISLRKGLVNRRWKKHSLPRKLLNKLQHALNGNGLTFDLTVKVLVAASLVPLAWRTEQEAEEVLDSISSLGSRVIFEIEETTAQTIQVTGLIFKSAVLSLGIIVLWFLGRAVTNRLVRAYHGNSLPTKLLEYKADGQTTWEVSGSKGKHVVWIRLTTPRQSACACRGFIDSGTCGHIDAAVDQARTMGLVPARAVQLEEASTAKDRGAAALRGMGVSGQSTEALCFTGMVDKAQRLFRPEKPNALTESGKWMFQRVDARKGQRRGTTCRRGKGRSCQGACGPWQGRGPHRGHRGRILEGPCLADCGDGAFEPLPECPGLPDRLFAGSA